MEEYICAYLVVLMLRKKKENVLLLLKKQKVKELLLYFMSSNYFFLNFTCDTNISFIFQSIIWYLHLMLYFALNLIIFNSLFILMIHFVFESSHLIYFFLSSNFFSIVDSCSQLIGFSLVNIWMWQITIY